MSNSPYIIGFDQAHKERGKISSSLSKLADLLNQSGFQCVNYAEYPITLKNLQPLDILFIPCPDNSRFSRQEIESISKWVKKGGSILMLSHAGGDKGRRSNLSELAEVFGMIFENNQVLDKTSNLGVENLPTINYFGFPHPITENITDVCYRAGCSLTTTSPTVTPVISSGERAEPFESPCLLACEIGEGRIVGLGSYEMFRDKISGGIKYGSHKQLALNIFSWLKTSKRLENVQLVSNKTSQQISTTQNSEIGQIEKSLDSITPNKTYESLVKIKTDEELIKAFEDALTEIISFKERMLSEFEIIQNNMTKLMKTVIARKEDLVYLQNNEKIVQDSQISINIESNGADNQENPLNSILNSLTNIPAEEVKSKEKESPHSQLTPPPSQNMDDVQKNHPINDKSPIHTSSISSNKIKKGKIENKEKISSKSKEELKAELDSLENKLNSIRNLNSFIEKKMTSGKITKEKYDKQRKKLDSDLKKTKYQMDEIKNLLSKF